MAIGFNADEVLEMAIRIERNGAAFYRKAAGLQSDEKNRDFFESLAAMEDKHQETFTAADALTGNETLEDIVNIALGLEKDSILFYLGLKSMVPPKYGRDKIEQIIEEERKHVAQLTGILNKVKAS
ncbi:hypothetical protein ES703_48704 [subsurface metagenome]